MSDAGALDRGEVLAAIRAWLNETELVPPAMAAYAPLVVDGLLYFLERLPASRLTAIVEDQLALGPDARTDERLVALLRRSPTLHKLGQIVAHEAGLPLELRTRLQGLESLAPAAPHAVTALIAEELGDIPALVVEPVALAEGSVAVVVPFRWDAPPGLPARGVFKALKPRAEAELLEDLAVWPALAAFLEARAAGMNLPRLDLRATFDGVASLLRNEIRLDREQERLRWARAFYADDPAIVVPALIPPLCGRRLTAMERIDGRKITESGLDAPARARLARTLIGALLGKPFWSPPAAHAVFHADPHAGNLFATDDGRLAIFDWALTTELSSDVLAAVVRLLAAAATLDEGAVLAEIRVLGTVVREAAVRESVAARVATVRGGTFPGFAWLTGLLDEVGRSGSVAFPEATALFRKSLLTLTGVVRDVSPHVSIDTILIARGGSQLLREAPLRAVAPFDSRAFGTHVSGADLTAFLIWSSLAPSRYVLGAYGDWLASGRTGSPAKQRLNAEGR